MALKLLSTCLAPLLVFGQENGISSFKYSEESLSFPSIGQICAYDANTGLTWMCYPTETPGFTLSNACYTFDFQSNKGPTYVSSFYPSSINNYQTLTNNCVFYDKKSSIYCWTGNRLFSFSINDHTSLVLWDGADEENWEPKDSSMGINWSDEELYILRGENDKFCVWSINEQTMKTDLQLPPNTHRYAPSAYHNNSTKSSFCFFGDETNNYIDCIETNNLNTWYLAATFDVYSLYQPVGIQVGNDYMYILGGEYAKQEGSSNSISDVVYEFHFDTISLKELTTLPQKLWQSCGVFDTSIYHMFVLGGAKNISKDGLSLIQYANVITNNPTKSPTLNPTKSPTLNPTKHPTINPTKYPTIDPTKNPTIDPTINPTKNPTTEPTIDPTKNPTIDPTINPTNYPTIDPTKTPTMKPTKSPIVPTPPTLAPTLTPTLAPTLTPTLAPTNKSRKNSSTNEILMIFVIILSVMFY